jgi:hypothetical protein
MGKSSVYTPQAIVDGSRDILGSQRDAVREAVSGRPMFTDIAVLVQSAGQGSILGAVA